jgi:hypothetical protein
MTGAARVQDKWYTGYLICICGFALMIWSFYPGMMSPDSVAALSAGREGTFVDINAPLMSALWAALDRLIPGPGAMFILQTALFWAGAAVFWKAAYRESTFLGLALVLFAFLPHILSQTMVIWKDIALGASLFFAAALLYYAKKSGSKAALLISPVFLFYAYAARLNAFPAVLPLAIWSAFLFYRIFERSRSKLIAALTGIAYFSLLTVAVYAVTYGLTGGKSVYPFQQIYLHDLSALSIEKGQPLFPEYIRNDAAFSQERVAERYNERSVSDLIYPDVPNAGDRPVLKLTQDAGQAAELRQAWTSAIKDDPAGYLKHRARVFAQLTGLGRSVTAPYWVQGFSSSPAEYRGAGNAGTYVLMKYFGAFRRPFPQTFFFRAFIWVILCGFFLYKAVRRRLTGDWDLVFVLSASTLLFTFAYFPTTPSTEFRYLFWPAISSALTVIFGVHLLRRERIENTVQ